VLCDGLPRILSEEVAKNGGIKNKAIGLDRYIHPPGGFGIVEGEYH
jgi:hypothetical protein